ncbi:hypothetical protein Tco_0848815 [Tanacetum coccineum]
MSSSSHYWKRRNADWEIDNLCNRVQVWCECGDLYGKWTSWTQTNPGRRFLGCRNYKMLQSKSSGIRKDDEARTH